MSQASQLEISIIIHFCFSYKVDNTRQCKNNFFQTRFPSVFLSEVTGSQLLEKVCFLKQDLNQRAFRILFFMETVLFLLNLITACFYRIRH